MDRRAVAVLAVAPFITMAGVLKQLPDAFNGGAPMPWTTAVAHTLVLLVLLGAHSWSYARWQPYAPNRILVNEFLTRLWFVLFGLLLVGLHGEYGGIYLVMAAAWAVASWCTHYLVLRQQDGYVAGVNLAMLGLYVLGLALMGLVCVNLGVADSAA